MSDETGGKQRPPHLFQPGQSGNPRGRPKGARNKLGEQFLDDLYSLWSTDGADVLKEAREADPMQFAKMVAGLLPKELLVRSQPMDDLTDDELSDILSVLRDIASRSGEAAANTRPI